MASQSKTVIVAGGTGFVGTHICSYLRLKGYNPLCLSRYAGQNKVTWDDVSKSGLPDCKAVINVAGENILNPFERWGEPFKEKVWSSRVDTTLKLKNLIQSAKVKPEIFLSISGVGIYEPSMTAKYDEYSPVKEFDYLSKLAIAWEEAAAMPGDCSTRQAVIRSGVVLGRGGGMISQIFVPFYFCLGGPLGNGDQYLPWIHVKDLARLFVHAIDNKVIGVLNGVAPQIVTNRGFTRAFASSLHRLAIFPVPRFLLNFIFSEERAKVMTEGQMVYPKRVLESGFHYDYPTIEEACAEFCYLFYNSVQ